MPLRSCCAIRHDGAFYGWTGEGEPLPSHVTREHLLRLVDAVPPGVSELGCHPGRGADCASPYRAERDRETDVLADPALRAEVARRGLLLRSFHGAGGPRCSASGCATAR